MKTFRATIQVEVIDNAGTPSEVTRRIVGVVHDHRPAGDNIAFMKREMFLAVRGATQVMQTEGTIRRPDTGETS